MKIRWSKYINAYPQKDSVILFHSVSRCVNKISKEDYEMINNVLAGTKPTDDIKKVISELYVDKCIVKEDEVEGEMFKEARKSRDYSGECAAYFIPTFTCNFRCPYCIVDSTEHGTENKKLTDEEVITMAKWLKQYVIKNNLKKLTIELFGGEPLVGFKQDILFLKELHSLEEQGIELEFNMISNCYLLTEEKVDALIECGLKSIQCTIDGPKEIHDKRRILASGKGSYDKIIENIAMLENKSVSLVIRINIDRDNAPYISGLLDELGERGFAKIASIGIAPVDPPVADSNISGHTLETMQYLETIYKALRRNNFRFKMWETFCGHGVEHFFVICPDGKLYNCPSFAGMKGYEVGNIYEGGFFEDRPKVHEIPDKCYECSLVGVCSGGCYFTKTVHHLNDDYCLEVTHSEMIKQYISNMYGD